MRKYLIIHILVVFCYAATSAMAQFNTLDTTRRDSLPRPVNLDSLSEEGRDSLDLERSRSRGDSNRVYFYFADATPTPLLLDTSLDAFEQVEQSAWAQSTYTRDNSLLLRRLTLGGLLGAMPVPTVPMTAMRGGFRIGLEADADYRLNSANLPVYEIEGNRAFTELYYSQINQRNTLLRATIAHQPAKGLYYSIHYGLINAFGYFDSEGVREQNIALHLRYRRRRSESALMFFSQSRINSENGGIQAGETVDSTSTTLLSGIRVYLSTAENNHRGTQIHFQQLFYSDSSALRPRWGLGYAVQWQDHRYKYFDTAPLQSYYADFLTNTRGIRSYIEHQTARADLLFRRSAGVDSSGGGISWQGQARLWGALHLLAQEPIERTAIFNLGITADGRLQLRKRLYIDLQAQAIAAEGGVDISARALARADFSRWLAIEGKIIGQIAQPSAVEQRLYLSRIAVWDNSADFRRTQQQHISAALLIPALRTRLEVYQHSERHSIYSDEARIVRQFSPDSAVGIFGARLQQQLQWRGWHLDNTVLWQNVYSGASVRRLPTWQLRHSAYWEGRADKLRVRWRIGATFHYHTSYFADGYLPITQQFYVQNTELLPSRPMVDLFVSARIWQTRVFVNAENISHLLLQRNTVVALGYALPNFVLRFGVCWRLFD